VANNAGSFNAASLVGLLSWFLYPDVKDIFFVMACTGALCIGSSLGLNSSCINHAVACNMDDDEDHANSSKGHSDEDGGLFGLLVCGSS